MSQTKTDMLDTPINFDTKFTVGDAEIIYTNVTELCQGCPAVGELTTNGAQVSEKFRFGGPALGSGTYLYAPVFVKLWSTGFKLVKIDLNSLELELIGEKKNLIFLDKIEDGYAYFHEDLEKTRKSRLRIHED